jgi:hypothetical protein
VPDRRDQQGDAHRRGVHQDSGGTTHSVAANGGTVTLTATDDADIHADAGGFAISVGVSTSGAGGGLSIGAAVSDNVIGGSVKAYIENSKVTATGNVSLSAVSTPQIDALAMGGTLAVGGGTEFGGALAIAATVRQESHPAGHRGLRLCQQYR